MCIYHLHLDVAAQLNIRAIERVRAFQRSGMLPDITDAISMLRQAVTLTPQGHGDLPSYLNHLGISLKCRFQRTGEMSDIAEAISMQQKAVELTPQGDAEQLRRHLSNLGNSLMKRFQRTGELLDITEAVSVQQRAVEITPEGHADMPACVNNLGNAFLCRFERMGELLDITKAISFQERAVKLTPEGNVHLPGHLTNLGTSFTRLFERTGELSDISQSISVQERAVELTPQGHAELPVRLNHLGASLTRRFTWTGELSDITAAISVRQRAVQLTPQGHANLPSCLNNLGNSFMRRFEQTGELSDITEAISLQRRAVELTPQSHAQFHARLSNLGNSFMKRFQRTGELLDITEGISVQQRAVEIVPQGHVDMHACLNNLGISLTRRFEQTGELSDIAKAISTQQRSVELLPQGHPNLPWCLTHLGTSFMRRFERTKDILDITQAISMQERTVQLTPQGHASLPTYLTNVAQSFYLRFTSSADHGDIQGAISHYKSAAISTVGPPRVRLDAARCWARILLQHYPQSPEIIHSFDTALGLVMAGRLEQTIRGRYTQLEDTSGLALEAASAACALDRVDKALEWLEQGRCLVWNQLNSLRTPLDKLRAHDSELARSISDIACRLENAGSSRGQPDISMPMSEKITLEDEARTQVELARQWAELLKTTRAIPGFESFLKPLPCPEIMKNLPDSGPIVVINIGTDRCDALVLLDGMHKPLHIPLPNFSEHDTTISGDRGIRSAPRGERAGDTPVHRVLRGLWEDVVKPILDALGFTVREVMPRIWWCPTGPLSFLPLHAAGAYRGPNPDNVLHYVVSSYTPTITAITGRVKNGRPIDTKASGLFLTSQPNAPDATPIPGTTREVQSIFDTGKGSGVRVEKLEGDKLSVSGCLERMQGFSSIHLACHGSQNATEPLQSRFLLHKGSLELGTILRSNLPNADLAFLSACQTSTGEAKLSDEAVHLAAGMLAAGYRRVVGTMWSIGDKAAQEVATTFYEYLFTRGEVTGDGAFDGTLSAQALHHATQQLRLSLDDSESSLLTWVPFVHFGY
ncbi:CHAT domain-containing protein [Ephemerocybe angulata]|uniref:CHAT domain-containing protein n=1 Tax=Ephemerocybe angulata TaxID=980116 RepID=A0A8H6HEH6_9AGAR|nr:CHAT domain-containing protein [Tulosesus angulatus]